MSQGPLETALLPGDGRQSAPIGRRFAKPSHEIGRRPCRNAGSGKVAIGGPYICFDAARQGKNVGIARRAVAAGHGITKRDFARSKQRLQGRDRHDRKSCCQIVENFKQLRALQPQLEAPTRLMDDAVRRDQRRRKRRLLDGAGTSSKYRRDQDRSIDDERGRGRPHRSAALGLERTYRLDGPVGRIDSHRRERRIVLRRVTLLGERLGAGQHSG